MIGRRRMAIYSVTDGVRGREICFRSQCNMPGNDGLRET